jgi:hypothetical protein
MDDQLGPARVALLYGEAPDADLNDLPVAQSKVNSARTLRISQNAKTSFYPSLRAYHGIDLKCRNFVLDRRLLGPFDQQRTFPAKSGWDCHFVFAFNPSSTRRRVASESEGISGWYSAHFTIEARSTGDARKPIMGSRPVAGRPRRFFGLAFIDISE